MAVPRRTIPAATTKTLLDWIDTDDGDTSNSTRPACTERTRAFHARVGIDPDGDQGRAHESLAPPAGLRLPPLG